MDILIDTHIALWFIDGSDAMPRKAFELIRDARNDVYVSDISVWEVATKHHKRPDVMPADARRFAEMCDASRFLQLPLSRDAVLAYGDLDVSGAEGVHKDPFDRMLVAQAKSANMLLLTHDEKLKLYGEPVVTVL